MPEINLSKLLNPLYDATIYNDPLITGLSLDSRKVKPGDLFFAYNGTQLDGRIFIDEAIEKGAVAILAEVDSKEETFHLKKNVPIFPIDQLKGRIGEIASIFYGHPSKKLKIIGITGTNGKTSCSYFIAESLHQLKKKCAVIGTLGSGLYGEIEPGSLTTPDPIELHALFAKFVEQEVKIVAMEVSSHSLDQGRINAIKFAVSIFTNLTHDHLDYHGTMEAYGAAKKKLFDKSLTKNAIINVDDPFGKELFESLDRKDSFAYTLNKNFEKNINLNALIYADQVELNQTGIRAQINSPWGKGVLQAPLMGQFNLHNMLATLATLNLLKIPFNDSLNALSHLSPVPGRMQTLGGNNQPLVVVDYAHTPDALEKALIALRAHCEGKLLCLFGCGGDRDRGKRPLMAKIAETYSDSVMVTDDNPRTEDPTQIVADIMAGFNAPEKIIVQHDRSRAIHDIIHSATVGDVVLIAGKGAEQFQQLGNQKIPFSDVEKVRENLSLIE